MRVEWRGEDDVKRNVRKLNAETRLGIQMAFDLQAARSTGYMKTSAPWTDQTSAARNGLHAFTMHSRNRSELILAHAVSYGIYLEVCNNGRYAVILPSLRAASRELTGLIDQLWRKI